MEREKKQKCSDSCNSASVEPMTGFTTLVFFLFSLGLKHYFDSNYYHLSHNSNIHPVCCSYVYVKCPSLSYNFKKLISFFLYFFSEPQDPGSSDAGMNCTLHAHSNLYMYIIVLYRV